MGFPDCASTIFETIEFPDVYHYTAIIAGKLAGGSPIEAVAWYSRMAADGISPDSFVASYALRACALAAASAEGKQLHAQILKQGSSLSSSRPVWMRLLEFYGKCGEFTSARKVFDEMPDKDAVASTILISCYVGFGMVEKALATFEDAMEKDTTCWTAMIDGLARNGRMSEALELFRRMQREEVRPNEVTLVCVLSACSQLGALELGRWVHSYVGKYGIQLNVFLGSALIDMYCRCGSLEDARKVFAEMPHRDVVSYNAMIGGLALHGRSSDARAAAHGGHLRGVLNACSHGGLVELGFQIFEAMKRDHGMEPQIEHYGCMVDLLARVGRLQEAYEFITQRMKIEPDHVIWCSLLGACKLHRDLPLGEKIARILTGGADAAADSGTYILAANVYAAFGKWEESARIREKMRRRGVAKEPGCSAIEVGGEVHEFLLGDIRHRRRREIYQKLAELGEALRLNGYSPATEEVLQDVGEVEKKRALEIHSERLAICYGLISTEEGATIRVVKNLRVCNDCHAMIKLVTKITGRKIVVRDRNRFHHFEDGACSCGDFW
ncbi:unnamed protein product [Spirodela intermedia]|uniref:DYW domain-containing protein n=1 Tax=Spirodela intermedia TaxID=51605 RepID=A0A7I8JCF0_SPIIN|nr:unnamed protein product [Spirodela intermedia]CAA6667800.1 unnamed protein product [Spirodela intermedia]